MFDLLFLGSVTVQEKTVNHVSWMMWLVLEYNFFFTQDCLVFLKRKNIYICVLFAKTSGHYLPFHLLTQTTLTIIICFF